MDPATGEFARAVFDLVVLSTGQTPTRESRRLAEICGLETNGVGYVSPVGVEKVRTARDGVLMCGSFLGLTDIGEALTSGTAAAGEASRLMVSLGRPFKGEPDLPPERPVGRELPRVAVFLCRWNNGKMPEGIDLAPLRSALTARAGVGEVHILDTLCRGEGFEQAGELLGASRCNRVLFAACLPYVYRQRLKVLAQKAGINPSLVEVVDIRSTIQRYLAEKDVPTMMRKVEGKIVAALEKLRATDALALHSIPMVQQALVVGGGVAGMRAALSLAARGIHVHLVERGGELGGRPLKRMHYTLEGVDPKQLVAELQQAVWENKRITVHKPAEIVESSGSLGNFRTVIRNGGNGDDEKLVVMHGATIIATGGQEAGTTEYCHGQSDRILTQSEVEDRLATGQLDAGELGTVVMIQCVGSRQKGVHDYCSRVCCAAALKNAFRIREQNPEARILVLYRDMMTYGFLERHYTRARGEGILFTPYELDARPEVELDDGAPVVRFTDPVLRRPVEVRADLLCLSTAIEAERSNEHTAAVFGLELTPDGFFQEAESKWRPVDFLKEGVFVAGTAHSPRPIAEVLTQAEAAAQRAFTYLSRQKVTTARVVSEVHGSLCSRCQTCVTICPYDARSYDPVDDRIVVDQAACQGCGMCAVACPNSAAEVPGVSERQTMAVIDAALQEAGW
jgi:heterodisulfide reductase subunit A